MVPQAGCIQDKCLLFYEQMKEFSFVQRVIEPEELDHGSLEEIQKLSDRLSGVVNQLQLRRKKLAKAGPT
jgi:hypothetical protein